MISITIRSNEDLTVEWPRRDKDVIALARDYLAYEASLPAEEQLQDMDAAKIQALVEQAEAAIANSRAGEAERAHKSQRSDQKLEAAKMKLDAAIMQLKGKHWDSLAILEEWGLETKVTAYGDISVRKPYHFRDEAFLTFLKTYIAKEESLPEEERITNPSLDEMKGLATTIEAINESWQDAISLRKEGIEQRKKIARELHLWLKACAAVLITTRFNGELTARLQRWGFTVKTRHKTAAGPSGEEEMPQDGSSSEPEATAAGETVVAAAPEHNQAADDGDSSAEAVSQMNGNPVPER